MNYVYDYFFPKMIITLQVIRLESQDKEWSSKISNFDVSKFSLTAKTPIRSTDVVILPIVP